MTAIPSLESQIYVDEISSRQRRSLQQKSPAQRLREARQAQAQAGFRIRVSRPVANQSSFMPELKQWIPFVQAEVAQRRSLGNLAITIFDSSQQPLRYSDGFESEEYLRDRLGIRRPKLLELSPPVEVTGIKPFGSDVQPFIGLTLARGFIYDELDEVRRLVAPELALDRSHQLDHVPHVTLGQVRRQQSVPNIMSALSEALPEYVQFGPADISYQKG